MKEKASMKDGTADRISNGAIVGFFKKKEVVL
jgi:hypothetical protein